MTVELPVAALQALEASEERLRVFVENAPAGLAMFDRDMRYIVASRRYADIYRLETADLVGHLHTDVFPDIPERWKDVWRRCMAGAIERAKDDPFPRADGTLDYVDWEMRPWRDAAGAVGGLILVSEVVTEKRLAAEALARSEERFRALFERAPIGMAEIGVPNACILRANDRLASIAGISVHALREHSLLELVEASERETVASDIEAVRRHPTVRVERELVLTFPSGKKARVTLTLASLDANDQVIVTVEDLTKKRAAEALAHAAEERWLATMRAAPVAIVVAKHDDGTLLEMNPAFERLYGFTREEALGKSSLELGMFVEPAQREHVKQGVRESGFVDTYGVRVRRKDGEIRLVNGHTASFTMNGELCLVSVIDDVTNRSAAEAELSRRERQVGLAFERAPIGIAFASPGEGRWLEVNDHLCGILGYSREELLAKRFLELSHPDERARDIEMAAAVKRGERTELHRTKRYLRKDGSTVECDVHVTVLPGESGEPIRTVVTLTDITERRRAESKAHEAEARWAATVESLPFGVALANIESQRIIDVNPAFCRMTGFAREELVGRAVHEIDISVDHLERDRLDGAARRQERAAARDYRFRRKSGEERLGDVTVTAAPFAGQECLVVTLHDVTEERQAAAVLRAREQAVLAAFDNAPTGIAFAIPAEARFVTVNPRLCEMLGYSRDELLARSIIELTHPDDRAVTAELMRELVLGTRGEIAIVKSFVRKDGRAIDCDLRVVPLPSEPGAPLRTVVGLTDITDRREVARKLAASEASYRELVEHMEEPLISGDLEGVITYANPAVARFGYTPEELVGQNAEVFLVPEDRSKRHDLHAEVLATDANAPRQREGTLIDKAGRRHPVRHTPRLIVHDGKVVGVTTILTDLTGQREVEEQLRAAQRMEAVGRLAGGVAHDFNNLLTVILSYADIARSEIPEDSPTQTCLEEVHKAGKRAEGLTRQLLAFSRKQIMVLEPLSVVALIEGVGAMLRRLIGEDIDLTTEVPRELPLVKAEHGQLEQVLMNLAINSRDAMPDGGSLVIAARAVALDAARAATLQVAEGAYLELMVQDTGTGMDEATRVRIFEPFFTTKGVGKGTGLGLSTVYGIVKQFGGAVDVESEIGVGTVFRIYLPQTSAIEVPQEVPRSNGSMRVMRGNERIMVVEDDAALRRVVRRLLTNAGYRVTACASPEEALDACRASASEFDLVLTDVVMPGMNGHELARRVAETMPLVPIVFMSGYTDDALERLDVLRGNFIRKPFANEDLRRVIRNALDNDA